MLNKLHIDSGDMALALAVWFCTLPIIGFIAIPLLGRWQALFIATAAFFLIMAVCWGVCGVKKFQVCYRDRKDVHGEEQSDPHT